MSVKAGSEVNPDNLKDTGKQGKIEEVVVIRVTVYNPTTKTIPLSSRYKYIFRGRSEIDPHEALVVRYPVTNLSKQKVIIDLSKEYPELQVDAGVNSIREI